jgi:ElaB/YqjD/DUF883 family membrane-anchored ribosome-binding protein
MDAEINMNKQDQPSAGRIESPLQAAGVAVRGLGQEAGESARQLGQAAAHEAQHVGASARLWWASHRDDARQVVDHARERAAALSESTQGYVRERPFKALAVAAAFGAALAGVAMLASRRVH